MNRLFAAAAIFGLATVAQAAAYLYSGPVYDQFIDFGSPCTTDPNPPCTNYTVGMRISGSFATEVQLPANLPADTNISALVTSFNFTDGINTYSSSDPNVRRYRMEAATGSDGNIDPSGTRIQLDLWQSGSLPHIAGDRVGIIRFGGGWGALIETAGNNVSCSFIVTSPAGSADSCNELPPPDGQSSYGYVRGVGRGQWSIAVTPGVPTLSEWGLILLVALLFFGTGRALRRKRSM